jgi:hypothetical protein
MDMGIDMDKKTALILGTGIDINMNTSMGMSMGRNMNREIYMDTAK